MSRAIPVSEWLMCDVVAQIRGILQQRDRFLPRDPQDHEALERFMAAYDARHMAVYTILARLQSWTRRRGYERCPAWLRKEMAFAIEDAMKGMELPEDAKGE